MQEKEITLGWELIMSRRYALFVSVSPAPSGVLRIGTQYTNELTNYSTGGHTKAQFCKSRTTNVHSLLRVVSGSYNNIIINNNNNNTTPVGGPKSEN